MSPGAQVGIPTSDNVDVNVAQPVLVVALTVVDGGVPEQLGSHLYTWLDAGCPDRNLDSVLILAVGDEPVPFSDQKYWVPEVG